MYIIKDSFRRLSKAYSFIPATWEFSFPKNLIPTFILLSLSYIFVSDTHAFIFDGTAPDYYEIYARGSDIAWWFSWCLWAPIGLLIVGSSWDRWERGVSQDGRWIMAVVWCIPFLTAGAVPFRWLFVDVLMKYPLTSTKTRRT